MKALNEWRFRFWLHPAMENQEISREFAEEVLFGVATGWANEHEYGIGGGLDQYGATWSYSFGLCATHEGQLIPESEAQELFETLEEFCKGTGYKVEGGYEEFS